MRSRALTPRLADYTRVTELQPGHAAAAAKLRSLQPVLEAKREALKEEMLNTLKGFGNSILGKFGLSLDNFKADKDPATGSYSIRFEQSGGAGAGGGGGDGGSTAAVDAETPPPMFADEAAPPA